MTNDDVAVQDSLYTAGRRGVGVTVLVEKIAGARAEAGGSLADVAATATKVNGQGRSMGLALTSCIVPAAGTPTFELGDDEVEVGIGIHGEPGRRREKLAPVDEMAEWLVAPIVPDLGLKSGDNVLAFVNGMGGTPLIELYIAFNSVAKILGGQGIAIGRTLVGNYITSLEMAGFSVTLLRLDDELSGCGTHRSTRRPCAGASEPRHGMAAALARLAARARRARQTGRPIVRRGR